MEKRQRLEGAVVLMSSSQRDHVRRPSPLKWLQPNARTASNVWQDRGLVEPSSTRNWGPDALGPEGPVRSSSVASTALRSRIGLVSARKSSATAAPYSSTFRQRPWTSS